MKTLENKTKNKENIFEKISFFFMYGRQINSNVPLYSPLVYGKIKQDRNYQK
jgi:hypothetical protein